MSHNVLSVHRRLVPAAFVLAAALIPAGPAFAACDCSESPQTLQAIYDKGDLVFTGKAGNESLDPDGPLGYTATTQFSVETLWKGYEEAPITLVTSADNDECGFRFEPGGHYIVVAYTDPSAGGYTTTSCIMDAVIEDSGKFQELLMKADE